MNYRRVHTNNIETNLTPWKLNQGRVIVGGGGGGIT